MNRIRLRNIRRFKIGKLVRDNIPTDIRARGIGVVERRLNNPEFAHRLKERLVEEAIDVQNSLSAEEMLEELCDVFEIMQALCKACKLPLSQVKKAAQEKSLQKGSFESKTYIDYIEIGESHPKLEYYLSHPDKYPEILVSES